MKAPIVPRAARVERDWPGSTVVCIGSGPSLTQADVDAVRGRAKVIAVNDAYRLAPWADALYACDAKWWRWHDGAQAFAGEKWAMQRPSARWPGVKILRNTGANGLETNPTGLRTGRNSGYQAINLAVHKGARRIILLGYDMSGGRQHFFGEHPDRTGAPFASCLRAFATLVEPLQARGIEIVNCTRKTALVCFPLLPLEEALRVEVAAA
jgi:hypothetical protein